MHGSPRTLPRLVRLLAPPLFVALSGGLVGLARGAEGPPPTVAGLEELRTLVTGGRYAEAEARARLLLAMVEARHGKASREAGEVLELLVEALWRGGKPGDAETLALAERAVAVREAAAGPDSPELASSLSQLGIVHFLRDDLDGAQEILDRSYQIRKRSLDPRDPMIAASLNALGSVRQRLGHHAAAESSYVQAARILEGTPQRGTLAAVLNNLARLLTETGELERARSLFERSIALQEAVVGPDHPSVATTRLNLASSLHESGDYASAEPLFLRALGALEKSMGSEHPDVARVLNSLGANEVMLGELGGAEAHIRRALAIRERALGLESPAVAACLNNLADIELKKNDPKTAERLLRRAIASWEAAAAPHQPELAYAHATLADVLLAEGAVVPARAEAESALSIREQAFGTHHPIVGRSLDTLARVQLCAGDLEGALVSALGAEKVGRDHLRIALRGISEQRALRQAASWRGVRELGLEVVFAPGGAVRLDPALLRSAWASVIESRGLVLNAVAARNRLVHEASSPEIAALAASSASALERLSNVLVQGSAGDPAAYRALVDSTRAAADRAEERLLAACGACGDEATNDGPGPDEVYAALPFGSALVAYVRFGDAYGAFVTVKRETKGSRVLALPLGRATEIDSLALAWRGAIQSAPAATDLAASERACRRLGAALRDRIWTPITEELGAASRVFVVPDGALQLVNFAALPSGDDRYLVEEGFVLHLLGSERDLLPVEAASGIGLLVLGDPDYDVAPPDSNEAPAGARARMRGAERPCDVLARATWPPVPATEREAKDIAKLWEKAGPMRAEGSRKEREPMDLRLGAGATEGAFKRAAEGHRVLHVATHAFFLDGSCGEPEKGSRGIGGLVPDAQPRVPGRPEERALENPLRLSGLVLAGANHHDRNARADEEDGLLTAEEVTSLDLHGVEWAVLSGCGRGVGDVRASEGVFGLRRAFHEAGARTLIMSLWPVLDEPARKWMKALYEERLVRRLSTSDAVQHATLALLADAREHASAHPFYWAGFVATGDWR